MPGRRPGRPQLGDHPEEARRLSAGVLRLRPGKGCALPGGAPGTEVAGLHIFYRAFIYLQFGLATAMAQIPAVLDDVARTLEAEGVSSFVKSFEELLATLRQRAEELRA